MLRCTRSKRLEPRNESNSCAVSTSSSARKPLWSDASSASSASSLRPSRARLRARSRSTIASGAFAVRACSSVASASLYLRSSRCACAIRSRLSRSSGKAASSLRYSSIASCQRCCSNASSPGRRPMSANRRALGGCDAGRARRAVAAAGARLRARGRGREHSEGERNENPWARNGMKPSDRAHGRASAVAAQAAALGQRDATLVRARPVAPMSARRDNARAGEVAEWLNAAVLKTVDPQGFRGFESLSLRHLKWSIPVTWVTVYSGDMGNTLAPKGFSAHSSRHVSSSKNLSRSP